MKVVVVYESMYGNTHLIADAIADGLRHTADVTVVSVHAADAALLEGTDLLVVGGPTHAHGMSRASTREAAMDAPTKKPESDLTVEPEAKGPGVREWLASLETLDTPAAAFDTRINAPAMFTGRASKGIARELREHGCSLIAEPESFLVTKETHLERAEEGHARRWGATLASLVGTPPMAR